MFTFIYPFVCLSFYLFTCFALVVLLLVLSFLSGFVFVVVSFSLAVYVQKRKGAKVLLLASSLVVLWVALSCCCFVFLVLVRCQPVNIVAEFYI